MAEQTEYLLGQPEVSELLMRALFLKGDLPQYIAAPYLATVQVSDLAAPEYMPLRRWRRFQCHTEIAPSAGNITGIVFGTPVEGNRVVMAVVEALWVRVPVATTVVRYGIEGELFSVPIANTAAHGQDDRSATLSSGATAAYGLQSFTNATSPLTGRTPEINFPNTATFITHVSPDRPLILTNKAINNVGKSLLWIVPTAVNAGLGVDIFWRERPILETEL